LYAYIIRESKTWHILKENRIKSMGKAQKKTEKDEGGAELNR
jgi:hypothetical protein